MDQPEHKDVWNGTCRGVAYEVINWDRRNPYLLDHPTGIWNAYVVLPVEQLPPGRRDEFNLLADEPSRFPRYPYDSLPDLPFPGGCTYYAKRGGLDGGSLRLRIGWDYVHSWDTGKPYSVDNILPDIAEVIDALWELVPDLRIRDPKTGKFVVPENTDPEDLAAMASRDAEGGL